MSKLQLQRIAIVLGVALALWGFAEILSGGSDVITGEFSLPNASSADTIEFRSDSEIVRLTRISPTEWEVNGFEASQSAIGDLVRAFSDAGSRSELVAQSPTSHLRMGVDSIDGRLVRVIAGERTLAEFFVGKVGRVFQSAYVRNVGDDDVYFLRNSRLRSLVTRRVEDWRERQIAAVNPDSVSRADVRRGRMRYALIRTDSGWTLGDGAAADSAAVRRMLERYRSFRALGFATPEEADSADFDLPDIEVSLMGTVGDTLAALVFDSTDADYFVRHLGGGTIYTVGSFTINQLAPADSTLRERR